MTAVALNDRDAIAIISDERGGWKTKSVLIPEEATLIDSDSLDWDLRLIILGIRVGLKARIDFF